MRLWIDIFKLSIFFEYVIPFTLIGVYILIYCVQAYKEYKIDEFMKSQGYNLKGDKSSLAWYDGNTFIEYQHRLHKNKIKEVKLKYRKAGDNNA